MSYPYSVAGAREFLDYLIDKGLLNTNTGGGMKSACEKVFSALADDEKLNLQDLDVEGAVRRYANKNPGALSPESLRVYQSRVQKVLELLRDFNLNPAGFKVGNGAKAKASDSPAGQKKSQGVRPKTQKSDPPLSTSATQGAHDATAKQNAVTLMFPLRPDFIAQFVMPKDLNLREAKKLAAYFELIAVDYEPD